MRAGILLPFIYYGFLYLSLKTMASEASIIADSRLREAAMHRSVTLPQAT